MDHPEQTAVFIFLETAKKIKKRFEGWKELEPVMETPCLFLDLHVNILLSVKSGTVIF